MLIRVDIKKILLFVFAASFCFCQNAAELRVVLQIPGMEKIEARRLVFKQADNDSLRLDIYYPIKQDFNSNPPVVVINNGIGIRNFLDLDVSKDWPRLIAYHGMAAVIYESRSEHINKDSEDVILFLRKNAENLNIDADRIGIFTSSGNVFDSVPLAMNKQNRFIRCLVVYYAMPEEMESIKPFRQDISILIVRAGLDEYLANRNIDKFLKEALTAELDFELINYLEGHHAFDIFDDNDRSRDIIKRTLDYFRFHLSDKNRDEHNYILTSSSLYSNLEAGRVEEAKKLLSDALGKYNKDQLYRVTAEKSFLIMASDLFQKNKMKESISLLNWALEIHPDSIKICDKLSEAYENDGDIELALTYSKKILELLAKRTDLNENQKNKIRDNTIVRIEKLKELANHTN